MDDRAVYIATCAKMFSGAYRGHNTSWDSQQSGSAFNDIPFAATNILSQYYQYSILMQLQNYMNSRYKCYGCLCLWCWFYPASFRRLNENSNIKPWTNGLNLVLYFHATMTEPWCKRYGQLGYSHSP